jgi:hypothetical protein
VDVGLLPRVRGCEGDVARGMPVFCCDFDGEGECEEMIDGGDDGAAGGYGEGAVLDGVWSASYVVVGKNLGFGSEDIMSRECKNFM